MLLNAYSIFDKKVEAYGTPFFMPNNAAATRAVADAARDPSTSLHHHPEDYAVVFLSAWDDVTGLFDDEDPFACTIIAEVELLLLATSKQEKPNGK